VPSSSANSFGEKQTRIVDKNPIATKGKRISAGPNGDWWRAMATEVIKE
jgi:hypothetical protein